jgi:hypothetical protein
MRILLVEDATALARSIAQGLTVVGFWVDVAGDGEEGLHFATEVAYDLIVPTACCRSSTACRCCASCGSGASPPGPAPHRAGGSTASGSEGGADDYLRSLRLRRAARPAAALLRRSRGQARNQVSLPAPARPRRAHRLGRRKAARPHRPRAGAPRAPGPGARPTFSAPPSPRSSTTRERPTATSSTSSWPACEGSSTAGLSGSEVVRTQRGAGYRLDPSAAGAVERG